MNGSNQPTTGRYVLRMPTDLYQLVKEQASESNVSINTFLVAVIAAAVNYRQ